MRIPTLKPMPDLKPIAKRIVTVDRMAALFMPRNLRGIRSPVKLASIEFFEDRRGKLPRDAGNDGRAPASPWTTPAALFHLLEKHELPPVCHGWRHIVRAGHQF